MRGQRQGLVQRADVQPPPQINSLIDGLRPTTPTPTPRRPQEIRVKGNVITVGCIGFRMAGECTNSNSVVVLRSD